METYKLGEPIKSTRIRVQHPGGGEQMTKQSMQAETDVNAIMARYMQTGTLTHLSDKKPSYGYFADAQDYLTAVNRVMDAHDQFQELPAEIRAHVNNSPAEFLEMVYDPERKQELVDLGLLPEQTPEKGAEPPTPDDDGEKKTD